MRMWKPLGYTKDLLPSAWGQSKAAYSPEGSGVPQRVFPTGPCPSHPGMDHFRSLQFLCLLELNVQGLRHSSYGFIFFPWGRICLPCKAPIQPDRFPGRKSQVSEHLTEIWVVCCHAHLFLECTGELGVLSWPAVTLAGLIGGDLWPLLVSPYFACPSLSPSFLSC